LHRNDLDQGFGGLYLPHALARKNRSAARETSGQYVFPARSRSIDPRSGKERRHHVFEAGLQKAVKTAVRKAEIDKRAAVHTLPVSLQPTCWKMVPIFLSFRNSRGMQALKQPKYIRM
jgi:hypothetical protein